jgi:hypothetical protein
MYFMHLLVNYYKLVITKARTEYYKKYFRWFIRYRAVLHSPSSCNFARQPLERVSNLAALLSQSYDCGYYVSSEYRNLYYSCCRNALNYGLKTSPTLPNSDISLGSLTLPAPKAADFMELLLLYSIPNYVKKKDTVI